MNEVDTGYVRGAAVAFLVLLLLGVVAAWWPIPLCPDCGPVIEG